MHFNWRTNPTVIAHYMKDADVPRHAHVTLKPNEVCVVLENGNVVGSVTQQHLEVNPQIGLFGLLFGKKNPIRSFVFAFTGPHAVLVHVKGVADNGDEINCLVTVKVEVTRESAPRLLAFPAKGKHVVQAADIADILSPVVNAAALPHFRGMDAAAMRGLAANDDVVFAIKSGVRSALDDHGLVYRGAFITWNSTASEQQRQHQHDLERLRLQQTIASDAEALELEQLIQAEQRKHEVNARMELVGLQAKEAADLKLELDRLKADGERNLQRWLQQHALTEQQAEAVRREALKNAETEVDLAKLDAERQRALGAVAEEAEANKLDRAMAMFEQVQARKRDRMALQHEHEQERLDRHASGSAATIAVLEDIAASSDDPAVKLEALKQLAELRKTDVAGQKDAYKID